MMRVVRRVRKATSSQEMSIEDMVAYLLLSKMDYTSAMTVDFNFALKIANKVNELRNPEQKEKEQHKLSPAELQDFIVPDAENMSSKQLKESRAKSYNYMN